MGQFFQRQWPFVVPFMLLWLAVGYLQFCYSQHDILLDINRNWTPALDVLFKYGTFCGDGLFVIGVAALFLPFSRRATLLILMSYLVSGLVVQLCKQFLFYQAHRPWYTLSKVAPWVHKVEGVALLQHASFPSGHTTSAFALFVMLALLSRVPWVKALCLLPALLVGFSRMYLLQHFLIDVHAGALLGVGTSVAFYCYVEKYPLNHPRSWIHRRRLV